MQNIENSKYRPPNLKMQNNKNLIKKKLKLKQKTRKREENDHFKNDQIYKIIIYILYIRKFKAKKQVF